MNQSVQHLKKHGYAVIKNFLSAQKCDRAVQQLNRLIDGFQPSPETTTVFDGETGQSKHRYSKYFLESSDKVRFFFEPKAYKDGKLIVEKRLAINKIGHSLHQKNKVFQDITYSEGVEELCAEVGIKTPSVVQSMAILKPPKIGGLVSLHQDSTYLYEQPETLLAFWMPLENATLKNGCLWGIPGSHKDILYKRSKVVNGEPRDEIFGDVSGRQEECVPIEMEKGSLAIFTGRFLHKSKENTSQKSRYAYTWHLKQKSSKWSPQNWLQRAQFPTFPLKNLRK